MGDAIAQLGDATTFAIFIKGYDVVVQNHFRPLWVSGKMLDVDTYKPGIRGERLPRDERKASMDFIARMAVEMTEQEFCAMLMNDMGCTMDEAKAILERKLAAMGDVD
jgi:hypothetical protein